LLALDDRGAASSKSKSPEIQRASGGTLTSSKSGSNGSQLPCPHVPHRIAFEPPPGMKVHPVLDLFPMMSHEEFAGLVWSIKKVGLLHPVSLDRDGVLLDGRLRLMACREAGVEPKYRTVDTEDPADFIIRENVCRMHHTEGQAALSDALIDKLYPEYFGDPDCPVRVLPEARLVAEHDDLVQLVFKGIGLSEAHANALERQRAAEACAQEAERLAQLREKEPFFALKVDEGELTLTEAIAAAHQLAIAPVLAKHAEAIRAAGKRVIWRIWMERRYRRALHVSVPSPGANPARCGISASRQRPLSARKTEHP
jgi:hypothetical protein